MSFSPCLFLMDMVILILTFRMYGKRIRAKIHRIEWLKAYMRDS